LDKTGLGYGDAASNLKGLRAAMESAGLDAYLVYGRDPHQSEYSSPHWNTRRWISGFSGSAGMLAVLRDKAGLWTDSRYAIQAGEELAGSGIDLFITGLPDSLSPIEYLKRELGAGARVGVNGTDISAVAAAKLEKELAEKGVELKVDIDLIAELWSDRPPLAHGPVWIYPLEYAGRSRVEKLGDLRGEMDRQSLDHYVVAALDAVAWLLNLRGEEGGGTFVAAAFVLVSKDTAVLFVEPDKIPAEVRAELEADGIALRGYGEIGAALAELPEAARVGGDPAQLSRSLSAAIGGELVEGPSLVDRLKCVKNPVEIANMADAHLRDGAAIVKFMAWFDGALGSGELSELSAGMRIDALRKGQEGMRGPSFETIAAYGPHAALPHYCASAASNLPIRPEGFFLLDSGGQYLGATTDISRTLVCGELSAQMRRDYSLVLMGLIDLSRQKFPIGSTGAQLDALARAAMWRAGIDFKHGTGHGVGSMLNVHEGPCGISSRNSCKIEAGMVLTIEPAIYRAGSYGIRLENMVVVAADSETEFGRFLRFDTVTMAPFDRRAIEVELLAPGQREWLDAYHREVCECLAGRLTLAEREWLAKMTRAL
jgi:Xaa-Pro aminopeptidase